MPTLGNKLITLLCLLWTFNANSTEISGIYLLEDPSRSLSFEQVKDREFEAVTREQLMFGPVYSDFWVKIELSDVPATPHYLYSCFIQADILDAYIPEQAGWREVNTGDTRRFSDRDVAHECYVFDLKNLQQNTIILRTYAGTNNRLPIELIKQSTFWTQQATEQFGYGFYFAILVSMVVYNFFLFLVTREAAYFYYVGYLGSIAMFLAEMSGHAVKYIWPDNQTWADLTPIMFAALAIAFGSRYIVLISNAKVYAPAIARLMWVVLPLSIVTIAAALMKGLAGVILLAITLIAMLTLSTIAITASARQGYRPGYVMVVAITMMVPGAFIYFLQAVGFIEENWLTGNILYITSSMEAMILSIALAYRIESLNQEIEQRDRQVNSLRARFSRQLIKTADNERRALARELHDGLGQGLLAVKNLVSQLGSGEQRQQAVNQIRALITDSRNLARNMHPQQIENLGFATALETMLIETIQPADMHLELKLQSVEGVLNHDTELQLYRIAQECASNIVRHSSAQSVFVSLVADEYHVVMTFKDNGVGLSGDGEPGIGLFNIQERAAIIGAEIAFETNIPSGTVVRVTLPKA